MAINKNTTDTSLGLEVQKSVDKAGGATCC